MTNRLQWVGLAALLVLGACGGNSGSSAPPVVPPSGLSYASPQSYRVGAAIPQLTPTVSGVVSSYSVSPPLPAGLSLGASTGVISGTPAAATATAVYTVTARNSGGQTTFGLSVTVDSPSVALLSGPISRSVVIGTSVSVAASIQPSFGITGTLYVTAADATGVFLSGVSVRPEGGGVYTLELTTSNAATEGTHAASVTLNLCEDAACQTPAMVPSIAVPFSVHVMTAASAWPGNNLTTLSPWPSAPDWATFQGNAGHTGYVPVTLNPDRFSTRWHRGASPPVTSGGSAYSPLSTVTTSGGQIFSAEGTTLLASSEHDGSINWWYGFSALSSPTINPPAVANGVVYIAAGSQETTYLFAFDAGTGTPRFRAPMMSQWDRYLAPTVGANGVYTEGGTYGGLYGFDTTGSPLFFSHEEQADVWSPAVDATGVYTFTGAALRVVDPLTGVLTHSIANPTSETSYGEMAGSPVLGAPGSVFAASYVRTVFIGNGYTNTLFDFDVATDTVKWQVTGDFPSTPAYRAAVLYATNINPMRLEARSEASGIMSWSWVPPQAGDTRFASEVLVTDNLVFVSTNLALYAVDITTHKTVWSYPLVGRLALSAQGVLYVAGQGLLTAFNLK